MTAVKPRRAPRARSRSTRRLTAGADSDTRLPMSPYGRRASSTRSATICASTVSIRHIIVQNRYRAALNRYRSVRTLSIMPMTAEHPPVARVLFDESHSEAWTIRPEVAREMQPAHPADSSYARAADALRARSLAVESHIVGPLGAAALEGVSVLVI